MATVDLNFFVDDFPKLYVKLDLEYELEEFIDSSGDFDIDKLNQFIKDVKSNTLDESNKVLFSKLCLLIENSLDGEDDECEVLEADNGTSFLLSVCGPVCWLCYEGDCYRYFRNKEEAYQFVENWQ